MEAWRNELYTNMTTTSDIYHHGVTGMRWGIRRYQNPDGTLTAKGRKRYGADLDITNKSKTNIARIRKGEAKRRYDLAKQKNDENYSRRAELKRRVKTAEKMEKFAKNIDKGAKLAEKGQTITGNKIKSYVGFGLASLGSAGATAFLNSRLEDLSSIGKYTSAHGNVASMINLASGIALTTAATAYAIKKYSNNEKLRTYYNSNFTGANTINNIGSKEYEDVVKRNKK